MADDNLWSTLINFIAVAKGIPTPSSVSLVQFHNILFFSYTAVRAALKFINIFRFVVHTRGLQDVGHNFKGQAKKVKERRTGTQSKYTQRKDIQLLYS